MVTEVKSISYSDIVCIENDVKNVKGVAWDEICTTKDL